MSISTAFKVSLCVNRTSRGIENLAITGRNSGTKTLHPEQAGNFKMGLLGC